MKTSTPTQARSFGSGTWHDLDRDAETPRTLCGRDASRMARFAPSDLPSGLRHHRPCARCRKTREASK